MTPATLWIGPADARRTAATTAALAALPLSYRPAGSPTAADVVVVSGAAGWPLRVRVAADAGARVVVMSDPALELREGGVAAAGRASAAAVVLAEPWASNPVLAAVRAEWGAEVARAGLIEASAIEQPGGRDLRSVLFAELRAVQRLGVEVASLQVVAETASAALAHGRTAAGAAVVLSAARSVVASGELSILLAASAETLRLTVPDGRTARPGQAVLTTADRAIELPTLWEAPYRAALLEARALITAPTAPDPLPAFAAASAFLA